MAKRLEEELSLPVFYSGLSRLGFEHPSFRLQGNLSNPPVFVNMPYGATVGASAANSNLIKLKT